MKRKFNHKSNFEHLQNEIYWKATSTWIICRERFSINVSSAKGPRRTLHHQMDFLLHDKYYLVVDWHWCCSKQCSNDNRNLHWKGNPARLSVGFFSRHHEFVNLHRSSFLFHVFAFAIVETFPVWSKLLGINQNFSIMLIRWTWLIRSDKSTLHHRLTPIELSTIKIHDVMQSLWLFSPFGSSFFSCYIRHIKRPRHRRREYEETRKHSTRRIYHFNKS